MARGTSTIGAMPSDRQLDDAIRLLAERGDHIGVIRIVETWAEAGSPTHTARLAAGNAFYALRQMDRATTRAREILDDDPHDTEALVLLARIYLERGWPQRARAPLTTLREIGEDDVAELWARAHQEPIRPETNARAVEREGTPQQQLLLAEQFLATGSLLRATGILERLRRTNPSHPRVKELLWGLAGEYAAHDMPLSALLRQLVPILPIRLQEHGEEPEHTEFTESLKEADRFLEEENPAPADAGAFPTLFKYAPPGELLPADDPVESTQSSKIASLEEMGAGAGTGEVTDLGLLANAPPSGGDTQIMLVLRPGQAEKPQKHRRRESADSLRQTLNLREYQAQMGMSAPLPDADTAEVATVDTPPEEDLLEDEDENVVMMTRPEAAAVPDQESSVELERPIEVIEKHPVPPPPPSTPPPEAAPIFEPELPAPPAAGLSPLLVGAFAVFALLLLVLAALLFVGGLDSRTGDATSVREELVHSLARQDYATLLREEGRIEQQRAATPSPALTAALAETRLALWSDYNGDPGRLQFVSGTLADPAGLDAHRLAFLRAGESLAREDTSGARASLGVETPQDDEERLLVARLWARSDDVSRALEYFARMSDPDAPRYRLAMAEVLADAGRVDEAHAAVQKVLAADKDHTAASLAMLELERGEPATRVASADIFLTRFRGQDLAPRFEGRVNVIRARAYAAMGLVGKARDAADAGLARDGTNPELLYVVAVDEAAHQRNLAAIDELDTVIAARPGDAPAQTARVLLLLDLDRVEEAARAVQSMVDNQVLPDLTGTLDALVDVAGRQVNADPPLSPVALATPLGRYTQALSLARGRDPGASDAAREAQAAVLASGDPFLMRLAPRLLALAATTAPAETAPAAIPAAEAAAGDDPVAHVLLGRHFESLGRRAAAAQHFDRATDIGPQTGVAWYERGRFYKAAPDGKARSDEAWTTYLALAPTGPRADRVRAAFQRP